MERFLADPDRIEDLSKKLGRYRTDMEGLIDYIKKGDKLRWDIAKFNFDFTEIKAKQEMLIKMMDELMDQLLLDAKDLAEFSDLVRKLDMRDVNFEFKNKLDGEIKNGNCDIGQIIGIIKNSNIHDIKKPKGMSTEDFIKYKDQIQIKVDELKIKDGWDKKAIKVYLDEVGKLKADDSESYFKKLDKLNKETEKVGSGIYAKMFEKSGLKPKNKALLVIDQMNGEIDDNGMLQLKNGYKFDKNMPPHSKFLEEYAKCVRDAYAGEILTDKRIHQFRMYIDRKNINYIRNNFEGATDFDKLMAYNKKMEEIDKKLSFSEPSRLHNRFFKEESIKNYEKYHNIDLFEDKNNKIKDDLLKEWGYKGQINDKVKTSNGLSEFIVNNKTGKFVTQWDVLKNKDGSDAGKNFGSIMSDPSYYKDNEGQKTIVETESFNYANEISMHKKLDMNPASGDESGQENELKREFKKIWKSKNEYKIEKKYGNGPYKEKISGPEYYEIYKEN